MEIHNFNLFPRLAIMNICKEKYDTRLQELRSDDSAMQNIAMFEKLPTPAVTTELLRNKVAFIKGVLYTLLFVAVSVKICSLTFRINFFYPIISRTHVRTHERMPSPPPLSEAHKHIERINVIRYITNLTQTHRAY